MPDSDMVIIKCTNPECMGVVAHASKTRGFVEVIRRPEKNDRTSVRVSGGNLNILANCHNTFCREETNIVVENGVLKTEGLNIKEIQNDEQQPKEPDSPQS